MNDERISRNGGWAWNHALMHTLWSHKRTICIRPTILWTSSLVTHRNFERITGVIPSAFSQTEGWLKWRTTAKGISINSFPLSWAYLYFYKIPFFISSQVFFGEMQNKSMILQNCSCINKYWCRVMNMQWLQNGSQHQWRKTNNTVNNDVPLWYEVKELRIWSWLYRVWQ